jgi:hypothetical protein
MYKNEIIFTEKYLMHFGTMKANEALDYDSDDLQRKKDERKSIEDRLKILNQNIHGEFLSVKIQNSHYNGDVHKLCNALWGGG